MERKSKPRKSAVIATVSPAAVARRETHRNFSKINDTLDTLLAGHDVLVTGQRDLYNFVFGYENTTTNKHVAGLRDQVTIIKALVIAGAAGGSILILQALGVPTHDIPVVVRDFIAALVGM